MAIRLSSIFNGGADPGIGGTGARATYAMLSRNTSTTWAGAAWYNPNFQSVMNMGYPATMTTEPGGYITRTQDSTHAYSEQHFWNLSGNTQSNPSSSSGKWLQGTNYCGEFGNAIVDCYSDGTINGRASRHATDSVKDYLNACVINSDHANRRIEYILYSGVIRAVDRLYGTYAYPLENTADYSVSSLDSNMQGSASYHAGRKELVILSYVSSGGQFNVYTFSNVDFNAYPNPNVALNRPEVVRTNSTVTMSSNWNNNNTESYYNLKPVIVDNGNVYVSVMFSSNSFNLYRFTRSGTSGVTGTYLTQQNLTTSYGREQGIDYGQRTITSRDGTTVATFCPYYYYSCGISCYMINKTNGTYTTYGNTNSSFGIQIVPWLDNAWLFLYCGNGYAGNYGGNYVIASYIKDATTPSGSFQSVGSKYYFPYHTGPNTTNYPGFTQVVDYPLLPFTGTTLEF